MPTGKGKYLKDPVPLSQSPQGRANLELIQ
jgi:hypothetical protein